LGSPSGVPECLVGLGEDNILPGCRESEMGDSGIGEVLDTLVPSYIEVLTPIQLPTFLGRTIYHGLASEWVSG